MSARPTLTVLPGGRLDRRRRAARQPRKPDLRRPFAISVREAMRQFAVRGGWWECAIDDRAELQLVALVPDGCVNTFAMADVDLDGDGACLAHDVGLPRELWDSGAARGVV